METTFEEVSSEFVLCARYGELKDMQDMLVQLCEHWSASMARAENLEAFKQAQLSTFLNARDSLGGGNTALHMAAANGHLGKFNLFNPEAAPPHQLRRSPVSFGVSLQGSMNVPLYFFDFFSHSAAFSNFYALFPLCRYL